MASSVASSASSAFGLFISGLSGRFDDWRDEIGSMTANGPRRCSESGPQPR